MSDRLVLYNKDTTKYVIFAKDFGQGFSLGNVDDLKLFLDETFSFHELLIGDLDILHDGAIPINSNNTWTLYPQEYNDSYLDKIKEINEILAKKDKK